MRSNRSLSADRLSSEAVALAVAEVDGLVSTAIDAAYPARRGDSHALPSLAYVGFRRTCPVCAGRLIGYEAEVTKRIVVTGASGNVGVALIRRLTRVSGKYDVLALARNRPTRQSTSLVTASALSSGKRPTFPRRPRQPVPRRRCRRPPRLALPPNAQRRNRAGQRPRKRAYVPGSHRGAGAGARVRLFRLAYSPGPHTTGQPDEPVDESWPTHALPTAAYGAPEVLRRAATRPLRAQVRHANCPPAQRLRVPTEAAPEQRRIFGRPFVPGRLLRKLPVLPVPRGLRIETVSAG